MSSLRSGELSLGDLSEMIDALDRPWAPEQNDRLRAHYHAARRDPRAKAELAEAIERSMRELPPEDLGYVIEKCSKRRSPHVDWAIAFIVELAGEVLGRLIRAPRRHRHRRHRHG